MYAGSTLRNMLRNFVPFEYWQFWTVENGYDLDRFPYFRMEWEYSLQRTLPYAVYAFERHTIDGKPTQLTRVTYKCLYSKHSFIIDMYP